MSIYKELPAGLYAELCQQALLARFDHVSEQGLNFIILAQEFLRFGVDTPSIIALAALPEGAGTVQIKFLFAEILEELGMPPLDASRAWWLDPSITALSHDPSILSEEGRFWLMIAKCVPEFAISWDPFDGSYLNADKFGHYLAEIAVQGGSDTEVAEALDLLEETLEANSGLQDLVVSGVLESVASHLLPDPEANAKVMSMLGPVTRKFWDLIQGGPRVSLRLVVDGSSDTPPTKRDAQDAGEVTPT